MTGLELDGRPIGVLGRTYFVFLVCYLILNRLISDLYVLPIGLSLRPYELLLAVMVGLWIVWLIVEPKPLPEGSVGIWAFFLLLMLGAAPFIHATGMSQFQIDGAERGLFRLFAFAGLFVGSYQLGWRSTYARRALAWVATLTAMQALLAIYEFRLRTPIRFLRDLALGIGLEFDPRSLRPEVAEVFQRTSGEVRAVTTAPHPIVLSAVVSLLIGIGVVWYLTATTPRAKTWSLVALGAGVLGLPAANSRTGFVIVAASAVAIAPLLVRHYPRLIPIALGGFALLAVSFALSPDTPRLLLNSVLQADRDANTQIRIERFDTIPELLAERPVLGAGYLTHDPGIQIFDNAYNLQLIEGGILGLALMVGFLLAATHRCAVGARLSRGSDELIALSGFLAGVALLVGGLTFDAWTFDQFLPTCLIVLGLGVARSDRLRRGREVYVPVVHEELP